MIAVCLVLALSVLGFTLVTPSRPNPAHPAPLLTTTMLFGAPATTNMTTYTLLPHEFMFTAIRITKPVDLFQIYLPLSWSPNETGSVTLALYVNGVLTTYTNQSFTSLPYGEVTYYDSTTHAYNSYIYTEIMLQPELQLKPGTVLYVGVVANAPIKVWGYPAALNLTKLVQKYGFLNPDWQPFLSASSIVQPLVTLPQQMSSQMLLSSVSSNFQLNVVGTELNNNGQA